MYVSDGRPLNPRSSFDHRPHIFVVCKCCSCFLYFIRSNCVFCCSLFCLTQGKRSASWAKSPYTASNWSGLVGIGSGMDNWGGQVSTALSDV